MTTHQDLISGLNYLNNGIWVPADIRPNKTTIASAKRFAALLPLNKCPITLLELKGDHGLILKWENKAQKVFLTINAKYLHLSDKIATEYPVFIDNVAFNLATEEIPSEILRHIPDIKRTV
ncbi:MAG: hypothetical protein KAS59_04695 [Alphaproteobacteria bacterium]|nr:hypothetical protein [Alphaproteobacteria bacterium]